MKHDAMQILLTKVFLTVGTVAGGTVSVLKDLDLIFGLILKFVSIISFVIVIVINMPNFMDRMKEIFSKKEIDGKSGK
jgi:ABC-type antimicrobial peptide transport system permease subunit